MWCYLNVFPYIDGNLQIWKQTQTHSFLLLNETLSERTLLQRSLGEHTESSANHIPRCAHQIYVFIFLLPRCVLCARFSLCGVNDPVPLFCCPASSALPARCHRRCCTWKYMTYSALIMSLNGRTVLPPPPQTFWWSQTGSPGFTRAQPAGADMETQHFTVQ